MAGFRSPGSLNRKPTERPSGAGSLVHPPKNQPLDAKGAQPLAPHEQASLDQIEAGLKTPATPSKGAQRYQDNVASRQNPPVQRASTPKVFNDKDNASATATGTPAPTQKQEGSGGISLPKYPGGLGGLIGAARGAGAFFKQRKKQTGAVGAILALIGVLIFGGGGALSVFKLVHIREVLNDAFGKRVDHMASRRIGNLWMVVADKDGNLTYERNTGRPLRDHLYNVKSRKVVEDLKARGLNVDLDPKTGKIRVDGELLSETLKEQGGTGKLAERRAFLKAKLKEAYPEHGFLRRSIRAQRVFRIYGIRRTFFEDSREKVDNWEQEMRKRIRERLFGSDTTDPTIKAAVPDSPEGNASKALEELEKNVGADAEKLRAAALADPNKIIPDVKVDIDEADLVKAGTSDALKGSLNATQWLAGICDIKNFLSQIIIGASILRERALVRFAVGNIMVPADQLKEGKHVTGEQVNAFMLGLQGFEDSPAWQQITGSNPNAKIPNEAKYAPDLTKARGGKAFFAKANERLDAIPGGGTTCKVVTNIFFQIGAIIVTVTASIFTGGGVSLASVATSASVSASIAVVEAVLKPMAIQMMAGMTVTGDEPGKDKGDIAVIGANIFFNNIARQNGGRPLKAKEAADLDRTIAEEQFKEDQKKGLAWRVFNLDNPRSTAARVAFNTPANLPEASSKVTNYVASINPFSFFQNLLQTNGLLARFSAPVTAYTPPLEESPGGITQMALTDEELSKYPDTVANEEYILGDPDRKEKFIDFQQRCLIGGIVDPEDQAMCSSTDDLYLRFRLYHLDLGLSGGIDFTTESINELPNDDHDGSI